MGYISKTHACKTNWICHWNLFSFNLFFWYWQMLQILYYVHGCGWQLTRSSWNAIFHGNFLSIDFKKMRLYFEHPQKFFLIPYNLIRQFGKKRPDFSNLYQISSIQPLHIDPTSEKNLFVLHKSIKRLSMGNLIESKTFSLQSSYLQWFQVYGLPSIVWSHDWRSSKFFCGNIPKLYSRYSTFS